MKFLKFSALVTAVLALCTGCGKDAYDFDDGSVSFNLEANYSTSLSGTKAESDLALNVDDFTLEIFNEKGKIKKWMYSEIKGQKVRLNANKPYTAKAFYGDSTATGFDVIYFAGQTLFTVPGQSSTAVSITCRMANVKVAIEWGDNIKADYTDYVVKVYREGKNGSLIFTKDETRCGYIPEGDIKMDITITDGDGKTRVYSPNAVRCEGNDFITFTIDSKPSAKGEIEVSFEIDSSTDEKTETITIPATLVAKDAPSFQAKGFTEENSVSFIEGSGVDKELYVGITAPAFMQSCVLVSQSEFLPSNWPAEIDLMGNNEELLSTIREYGIEWSLSGESRYGFVDFEQFTKKLRLVGENENKFSLIVTDIKGKSSTIDVSFDIEGATVDVNEIPDYDMWSTKAYIDVVTNASDAGQFVFEAMDGSEVAGTFNGVLVSREGNVSRYMVTGLAPSQSYSFRVNYANGLKYTKEVTGTTESAQQLVNGELENWSNVQVWKPAASAGTNSATIYRAEIEGWSTRNDLTTKKAASDASWWNNYGVYYKWCSNTASTYDAKNGYAAEIATLGFWLGKTGSFYTCGHDDVLGKVQGNGIAYTACLFLGSYDSANDSYNLGVAHNARPNSVSFWYKYAPCEAGADKCTIYAVVYDANRNEIARSIDFQSSGQEEYLYYTLNLDYSNTKAKAAYITVFFKSGDNTDLSKMHLIQGEGTTTTAMYDRVAGSILTVDGVVLNY